MITCKGSSGNRAFYWRFDVEKQEFDVVKGEDSSIQEQHA